MSRPTDPRLVELEASLDQMRRERDEARAREERFRVLIEKASDMVLVMDDEELVRATADMMLRHLGYDVVCTRDADEAAAEFRRAAEAGHPFDVVLLDLTVPGGKGGLEAAAELRKIDPQVVTVVSSGYSTDPVLSDPARHGFAAVVVKPYKLDSLSAALRRAVSGR